MFENIRHGLESSRTGEQATSVKRMQSGSSSRSARNRGAAVEEDAIGEQQSKRTQSGNSSRSARNRGAVEIGEEQPKRTQASSEQQLKQTETANSSHEADRCNRGAAAEADAIGEQQFCTESCPAPDYSRRQTRRK